MSEVPLYHCVPPTPPTFKRFDCKPDNRAASKKSSLFRGGLVFKAHRLLYHSTLGLRVIKKKKKSSLIVGFRHSTRWSTTLSSKFNLPLAIKCRPLRGAPRNPAPTKPSGWVHTSHEDGVFGPCNGRPASNLPLAIKWRPLCVAPPNETFELHRVDGDAPRTKMACLGPVMDVPRDPLNPGP